MEKKNITQISYHKLKREYYVDLCNLIEETAEFSRFAENENTRRRLAKLYFLICLKEMTFGQAGLYRDRMIGVVMGRAKDRKRPKPVLAVKIAFLKIRINMEKDGRRALKILHNIEASKKEMIERINHESDGEVLLCIVKKNYRRRGVGSELWGRLETYFKENNIKHAYGILNQNSNYEFALAQGFAKQEKAVYMVETEKQRFREQLYYYELERIRV